MKAVPIAQTLPAVLVESTAERLSALVDAHYDRLYRLARRLAPSADAARDLVQDTFLRAARTPRAIPTGARDEEAWLVRVLINIQRDEWRKSSVRARYTAAAAPPDPAGDDPEPTFIARATIWGALDALPPRRRAILVMHELDGMSVAAIAALLGIAGVTVRWHLSRGRRELARILGVRSGDRHEDA
ncbi:MAG TPA: RNA polymerase sigma factor [Vicinamibacterales bacterium]|nr:RNA polymerase sigma factor [Vicinamibacterales bacterium]